MAKIDREKAHRRFRAWNKTASKWHVPALLKTKETATTKNDRVPRVTMSTIQFVKSPAVSSREV